MLDLHGLWSLMVGLFCMQTSTIASAVTASWCWKFVQFWNIFYMLMVSIVRLDNIDIFSWMERSALLSMLGPINWSFSSTISNSHFICGQMMSNFSRFGIASCTHWCACRLCFYNLAVSSTIWFSIVLLSSSSMLFLFSSTWISCQVCQTFW